MSTKYTCGQCEKPAVQAWKIHGEDDVARCADHAIPFYDVGSAWTQVLPEVKK